MTEEAMTHLILDVIDCLGVATIGEIMDVLGPEAQGDQAWTPWPEEAPVWRGMSETAVDAFSSLWGDIARLPAPEGEKNPPVRFVLRDSLPLPDAAQIYTDLQRKHESLHAGLRESRRGWQEAIDEQERKRYGEQNSYFSSQMMLLREIGRFMLNIHPEDCSNPFGGPEDY